MRLSCKLHCLGCLLKFFFQNLLFLSSGRLDLIEHPLAFHRCRILQWNLFSFYQNYSCYLRLQMLCLKKVFNSLKPTNIGKKIEKRVKYINFLFPCHVQKSCRYCYPRTALIFRKLKITSCLLVTGKIPFLSVFSHL